MLRYFNFEPSFKLRWCHARDLFESQIPVTTGGFERRIFCIRSSYLTHLVLWPSGLVTTSYARDSGLNPPVVIEICDPNKSRARHHRNIQYIFIIFKVKPLEAQEPSTLIPTVIYSFNKSPSRVPSDILFLPIHSLAPIAAFFILFSVTSSAMILI